MTEWFGRVIGMGCAGSTSRSTFAPVVTSAATFRRRVRAPHVRERSPNRHGARGRIHARSHEAGVAACLKHWPGIGIGSADPHYGATVIDVSTEQLIERDLVPYQRLGREASSRYGRREPDTMEVQGEYR
jgi:beta-N-acetylhexosaminidase